MPTPFPSQRSFIVFGATPSTAPPPGRRWQAPARDFKVEWIEFDGDGPSFSVQADAEPLLIVVGGALRVLGTAGSRDTLVPADGVAIIPAGAHTLQGERGARCAVITALRGDTGTAGTPYQRLQPLAAPLVLSFEQIKASPEKPRLKMLQTDALSINIVDYQGPRDRSALSPHSHADFEQGSLAIEGQFVHHLRTPWGSDADRWRDDEHLQAPSPSLVVVPPHVIHTTEGTGPGRHLLIDVFSPPRRDFIASNWVFNAADYRAATTA